MIKTAIFLIGLALVVFIFGPLVVAELRYQSDQLGGVKYFVEVESTYFQSRDRLIIPADKEFSIVIPKIYANARIYSDVNPLNREQYLPILKKGIAQARGSVYPGQAGNIFLFAHADDAFYNISHYNTNFLLLNKLDNGDEIDIFFHNTRYKYAVTNKIVLSPGEVEPYINNVLKDREVLILQTGSPPGTSLKRLLVIAKE